ncbi:glycerophosphodiester phosphodiesterase family protein [Exiguobacterium sp. SL14]|nr:glycerophosphodiester phosphodiesterase family protein [Exiguobacterium sp. SL14]MCY1690757.1 glycerophosphodiester phosphodiesterase family protein [Exiguobacterium sp. SL14]
MAAIMGMWGAECDLGLTSDGKLVLMHDATVDRTTDGTGTVSSRTLAEIQAMNIDFNLKGFSGVKVPTIDQYLLVCKEYGLRPVIEVKDGGHLTGMADALLIALANYNMTQSCILISFGEETLQYIRSKNADIYLGYLLNQSDLITLDFISFAESLGNCAINAYGSTNLTKSMVDNCHVRGIPVMVWTVNDRTLANYLEAIGVDMITTDTLVNPRRNKKIISATFSSADNGVTWTKTDPTFRDNVTVTKTDDYLIEVAFDGHWSQAIINMSPIAKTQLAMNTTVQIETQCHRTSSGKIGIRFFQNGIQKKLSELPAYVQLYCEVVF